MTNHQPFLTGFPTQICGSIRRRLQDVIAAKRRAFTDSSIATYAMQFSHVLPADFLHGLSVSQRIRQYCNVVVFWAWPAQILEANASLSKAVSLVQAWCADASLPVPNKDTGSYSRGRGRLPIEFLTAANSRINSHLGARIQPRDTYQGHIIKSIDGSSMTLDDTKGNHLKLLHCFHPGDILCGDRAFAPTNSSPTCMSAKSIPSCASIRRGTASSTGARVSVWAGTSVANTSRYLRRQRQVAKIREIWASTIEMIAEKVIGFRPFRKEPRAQKKRPKSYSYLTAPQAEYKGIPHRGKYRACP